MSEVIVIIVSLAVVVVIVAYKYWTLGSGGAEFDLVVKRGESLGDPRDPHSPIELNLSSGDSPEPGRGNRSGQGS